MHNLKMRKMIFTAIILSVVFVPVALGRFHSYRRDVSDHMPAPRLVSPIEDKVDLSAKKELEFKWSPHEGVKFGMDYFDFRLYKGYDMLESTLILKKRVEPGTYSVFLSTDLFENGGVYTWSLRLIYSGSGKSDKAYSSFKVIKDKNSSRID